MKNKLFDKLKYHCKEIEKLGYTCRFKSNKNIIFQWNGIIDFKGLETKLGD